MNSRVWLIILLIVSLACNLLVLGVIIGRHLSGSQPEAGATGKATHLGWLTRNLDAETLATLRHSLKERRHQARQTHKALRAAQQHLLEVIQAEPFDAGAVKAALTALREVSTRFQEVSHQHIVEILATMKPDDRVRVYRLLSRRATRGHLAGKPDGRRWPGHHGEHPHK